MIIYFLPANSLPTSLILLFYLIFFIVTITKNKVFSNLCGKKKKLLAKTSILYNRKKKMRATGILKASTSGGQKKGGLTEIKEFVYRKIFPHNYDTYISPYYTPKESYSAGDIE